MKPPALPPAVGDLLRRQPPAQLPMLLAAAKDQRYLHWDKLRHLTPPDGLTSEQWWLGIKIARMQGYRRLPFRTPAGEQFVFALPDCVLQRLHRIDSLASGRIGLAAPVATEEQRDRFIFNSLVEEAITSSQLEGASTTRQVAADMLRSQRHPRDNSERMILNNYRAMESVRRLTGVPLDFDTLMALHRTLTEGTLVDEGAAGRIQRPGEQRVDVIDNASHRVLHEPPPARDLRDRLEAMLAFANQSEDDEPSGPFVHPVIRAIVLHFWLAYEHPFLDGNGRTARALFYWAMLRRGYWLFEFLSISRVLKQAPARYGQAFLYTETDDNDLTYFVIHQLGVIEQALAELTRYLERKAQQLQRVEALLRDSNLNHRQISLLSHAIRHPGHEYTIKSHQTSHRIAYATARADLLDLAGIALLTQRRRGKKTLAFIAPDDLEARIREPGA